LILRVIIWSSLYLLLYLAASALDLWTTKLALLQSGVSEGNVFAYDGGAYSGTKAWIITGVGGLILVSCVAFAVVYANRVSSYWLRNPMKSFARMDLLLYAGLNPWAKVVMDRSALHMMSYALGMVALRLLAAGNNWLLSEGRNGPLGAAIELVAARSSPLVGMVVVIGAVYLALTVVLSPLAAFLLSPAFKATLEPESR